MTRHWPQRLEWCRSSSWFHGQQWHWDSEARLAASQLLRLATCRAAITNGHSHIMFCWYPGLSLRPFLGRRGRALHRWELEGMSCPSWQWHRIGSRWSPVRTLPVPVAPLWCDLGFVPNSRGNKAAANLRPTSIFFARATSEITKRYSFPVLRAPKATIRLRSNTRIQQPWPLSAAFKLLLLARRSPPGAGIGGPGGGARSQGQG